VSRFQNEEIHSASGGWRKRIDRTARCAKRSTEPYGGLIDADLGGVLYQAAHRPPGEGRSGGYRI